MRKILFLAVTLCFIVPTSAQAQCNGQTASGNLCGNSGASQGLPQLTTPSAVFDKAFGATPGLALFRGNSGWTASVGLVLGTNGGTGGSITLNGSTSGSAVISVPAAAGTTTFQLPSTNGSPNFILQTDGSGHLSWTAAGGGTVSSVALAMPSIFAVSGSPVTSTGTLTAAFNTQSANLIFGGPSSGIAATPTFRTLVGADLPNPTTSSLGGIQAINAVTSNWIRSINASGVPQLSQPAFTDISGTLAASQCPNPSASTIGCVESYVAVAHQWINAISTSGVPSSTQPAFADLAGEAILAQLPAISNNSILANNSGGTSVPGTLTTSQVLDMIDNTQGDILYRGATSWNFLGPGTSGQVLSTGGTAANPSWTTVTGTGTVTSIATNNGITGGTITTSGTIGLASITAHTVLANTTGAGAVPTASTPSSILDIIGSAAGDVLYRAAGGWQALAPGTNGQVLTQGASTPSWSNAGTLTNVTIAASTGLNSSGTCNITTSGTCTLTNNGVVTIHQQVFTSSGTYTASAGLLYAKMECVGGGGGGGGAASALGGVNGGGGGGGGAYSRRLVAGGTVGASQTITIGAAGSAGALGANSGGAGGSTSVGTLCVASGGSGGIGPSGIGGYGSGGAGGSTGTGDFTIPGEAGGTSFYSTVTTSITMANKGGNAALGFGAGGRTAQPVSGSVSNGTSGSNYGAGGSGGMFYNTNSSNAGGAAGTAGIVIITEYCNQ